MVRLCKLCYSDNTRIHLPAAAAAPGSLCWPAGRSCAAAAGEEDVEESVVVSREMKYRRSVVAPRVVCNVILALYHYLVTVSTSSSSSKCKSNNSKNTV